jgi:hypothetical protein
MRKQKETDLGRGRQGEARTPEVDSTVQQDNVKRGLAKPKGGRDMENSSIREPSGRHIRQDLHRQSRQAI